MKYSLIIPVYNRPDEVEELLQSLVAQSHKDFEVIVVEDGSSVPCHVQVNKYAPFLHLKYVQKTNSGPGPTRNFGAERAEGEFLIFLDSDCVIPPGYLTEVDRELNRKPCDAFGGPDRAHPSFSNTQKAINYSMTSFFTTGGIRGGKKKLDKFFPRSFNMGIRADLYKKLGGFSPMRFGEDIDLSLRIVESGAQTRLFPQAWVWHKRRTDVWKFFKQVHNSGIARINLEKRHPGSMKLVHLLPAAFTVGAVSMAVISLLLLISLTAGCPMGWACVSMPLWPLVLYALLVGTDSAIRNRSLRIGMLSILTSYIQLLGYGSGFLRAWWLRNVCGKNEELQAFRRNYYE